MDLFTPSISFMHSPCHLFLLYYNFIESVLCSRPRARHREDTSSFIPFPWCLHDTACIIFICVHILHKSLKLVPRPNLSVSQTPSWGNTPGRLHRCLWKLNLTCVPKAGRGWRRWNLAKLTGVKPKAPAVSSKAIWAEASWSAQQGRRRAIVNERFVFQVLLPPKTYSLPDFPSWRWHACGDLHLVSWEVLLVALPVSTVCSLQFHIFFTTLKWKAYLCQIHSMKKTGNEMIFEAKLLLLFPIWRLWLNRWKIFR